VGAGGAAGATSVMAGGSAGMGAGGAPGIMGGGGGRLTGGAAGSATGGSGGAVVVSTCTLTTTATMSEVISTVFNVEFTTDYPSPKSARIDFGTAAGTYEFSAPVDLAEPNYKTPLLGMKGNKEYHYQVVVKGDAGECRGADQVITTGPVENGLAKPMIQTPNPQGLYGGFLVTEWYAGKQYAFILDKDAEIVWWFNPKDVNPQFGDVTRARMSYDGKYMWIAHGNVPSQTGRMVRVRMDGTGGEDLSSSFPRMNHDFTVLPDETIYFVAYSATGQCDDIVKYNPGGAPTVVMNLSQAFNEPVCHANAVEYSPEDDTLVASDLDHDAYVKINRQTGAVIWVLGGGSSNDFTGDGSTWDNQHNLHMLGANHLVMFNNGSGSGSKAIELELDPDKKTATKLWEYAAMPAIANVVMGDVQRLDNGNTLVTYSTQGVIHEVDKNGMLLQSLSWGASGALGYAVKRPTLYGPPPK
jgi:hypothetical protein